MKKSFRTGVLLVNLGTPDSPKVSDVRKYLREFLMDKRVIDIPFLKRWMLINFIIAPFRAPKSAKIYNQLWEDRGSPLLFHGIDLQAKLQEKLANEYIVELGMRYQSPSLASALQKLHDKGVDKIIVLPLFPQYASASTGSVHDKVMEIISAWQVIPDIKFISQFFDHGKFIEAFAERGRKYLEENNFDHIVFSYHGLPERQIHKASHGDFCKLNDACCAFINTNNRYCYRAQCFETSRLIASAMDIPEEKYTNCFQSRLGKNPWIQPFTDDIIKKLPSEGKKNVLAFSPAFVADCLETTVEVGDEFKEMFLEAGGEKWQLVESLNSSDTWIDCLSELVLEH